MDLIYFLVSKKIIKLISTKYDNKIVALLINVILEIKMINKDKNIKSGKSGWNPFIPIFNLIKFKKSIPKQDLWSKNPKYLRSLW